MGTGGPPEAPAATARRDEPHPGSLALSLALEAFDAIQQPVQVATAAVRGVDLVFECVQLDAALLELAHQRPELRQASRQSRELRHGQGVHVARSKCREQFFESSSSRGAPGLDELVCNAQFAAAAVGAQPLELALAPGIERDAALLHRVGQHDVEDVFEASARAGLAPGSPRPPPPDLVHQARSCQGGAAALRPAFLASFFGQPLHTLEPTLPALLYGRLGSSGQPYLAMVSARVYGRPNLCEDAASRPGGRRHRREVPVKRSVLLFATGLICGGLAYWFSWRRSSRRPEGPARPRRLLPGERRPRP